MAKGAYIHLGNKKPHLDLSEARNLPAGTDENCKEYLRLSNITTKMNRNYNQEKPSNGSCEHFLSCK